MKSILAEFISRTAKADARVFPVPVLLTNNAFSALFKRSFVRLSMKAICILFGVNLYRSISTT